MSKKRILIIAPRFPFPIIGGDRLRIYQIGKHLHGLGYDVDLACLCSATSEVNASWDETVFNNVHRIYHPQWFSFVMCIFGFFSKLPLQTWYYRSRNMKQLLLNIGGDYDVVVIHLIRMMPYVSFIPQKVILEMTDAISFNYSRVKLNRFTIRKLIYLYERAKLLRYEKECILLAGNTFVVSSVDRDYLIENGATPTKVSVAPNGVSFSNDTIIFPRCGLDIAFVGNMISVQNQDAVLFFITKILPILRQQRPEIRFKVIGRISNNFCYKLSKFPGVLVTGEVDDITLELHGCIVAVCPILIGAGVQNKVLEYFCNGLPVVLTTVGAEGLDVSDNVHVLIADAAEDFARCIIDVIDDRVLAEYLVDNALRLVKSKYEWSQMLDNYTKLLEG